MSLISLHIHTGHVQAAAFGRAVVGSVTLKGETTSPLPALCKTSLARSVSEAASKSR